MTTECTAVETTPDALQQAATMLQDSGFNLTIEEVRILAKYRALSRHQQKGILQAIELIRPAEAASSSAPF